MHIPSSLPQFNKKSAVVLVTGRHAGKLFYAHDGEIEELESFEEPTPHYSDNESFYQASGKGKVIRSGAMREIDERDIAKRFLKKATEKLRSAAQKLHATDLYLFSPREHELENKLPSSIQKLLRSTFIGSYARTSIKRLLSMIQQKENERLVSPVSEEALDLMNRNQS